MTRINTSPSSSFPYSYFNVLSTQGYDSSLDKQSLNIIPVSTEQKIINLKFCELIKKYRNCKNISEKTLLETEIFDYLSNKLLAVPYKEKEQKNLPPNKLYRNKMILIRYFAKSMGYKSNKNTILKLFNKSKRYEQERTIMLSSLIRNLSMLQQMCEYNPNKLDDILEKSPHFSYLIKNYSNENMHMLDLLNAITNSKLDSIQAMQSANKGIEYGTELSCFKLARHGCHIGATLGIIFGGISGGVAGGFAAGPLGAVVGIIGGAGGGVALGSFAGYRLGNLIGKIKYEKMGSKNFTYLNPKLKISSEISHTLNPGVNLKNIHDVNYE